MMLRRGFLKALGIAPLAAVKGAEQVKTMALGYGMSAPPQPAELWGPTGGSDEEHIKRLKDMLGWYTRQLTPEEWRDTRRMITRLDPDLVANQSFSLATRLRLQAIRDVEADRRDRAKRVRRDLAKAMRGGKGG